MPYAPGVNNQSGQILASGINSTMAQYAQDLDRQRQEEQKRRAAAGMIQGILRTDPTLSQQVDPKILDKFMSGKANLNDTMQLSGTLTAIRQDKEDQSKQAYQAQHTALMGQQVQGMKQEIDQRTNDQKAMAAGLAAHQNEDGSWAPFDPSRFATIYAQNKGSPAGLNQMDTFMKMAMPNQGSDSPELKRTNEIINERLRAGTLDPVDVPKERARILSQGGKELTENFSPIGTWVKRSDRSNPITVVLDKHTSKVGFHDPKTGEFKEVDPNEYGPSTQSDANPFLTPEAFTKLSQELTNKENSVRALDRFMTGVKDLPSGIDKLSTRISASAKTIMGEKLTPEEQKMGVAQARQQRLLGALRTTILGPGVLTENDAARIMAAVGGDINSIVANPAVMNEVLADIMGEKYREYERDLGVYNAHVASGGQAGAGHKQRTKVPVKLFEMPTGGGTATPGAPPPPGWKYEP